MESFKFIAFLIIVILLFLGQIDLILLGILFTVTFCVTILATKVVFISLVVAVIVTLLGRKVLSKINSN